MSRNLVGHKRGRLVLYTVLAFVLLSAILLSLAGYLYTDAEDRAMETLHVQTKQIKDDLTLQMLSDRENLTTMASFAAKLYLDGDDYSLLFDSFKEIGLISNIGILSPDNVFVTKNGKVDLQGQISFAEEAKKGAYISGRVKDVTNVNYERVRSAVPIVANGETVGVLYGIIRLENVANRYVGIATELDAQIFIYEATTGDLIVDSVHEKPGNISFLKDREYRGSYSYEEFAATDKGFSSFRSAYRDEDVLLHYSTIEDLGWKIAVVRYDSQVYAETHTLLLFLSFICTSMVVIMGAFSALLMMSERRKNDVVDCAATVRKILIEASGHNTANNISEALREVVAFTRSSSALFFDTNDEDYYFIAPEFRNAILPDAERKALKAELFRYVSMLTATEASSSLKIVSVRADKRLEKTHASLYAVLSTCGISELVFAAAVDHANHITVLSVVDPKRKADACNLSEKVAACFAIALKNHNILSQTKLAATTDSLTGVANRVAYNSDLHIINEEKPFDFACIYVDVNELHSRNNKYGHAAGDEMLLYIAYTLKDVFFGQKVYRMGGDEFLVFCRNLSNEEIQRSLDMFFEQLKTRDYHVAIGVSFRSQNTNTEEMVREAEVRMYESKAKYYQNKKQKKSASSEDAYVQSKTGIPEIDTLLSVLKERYNGIYRVSLETDKARRVLMPAYLHYNEVEEHFSNLFTKYVSDMADPDYHRALLSFLNYDALKQQIAEGAIPSVTYKKLNGETVTLSVYRLGEASDIVSDTLWIFSKQ